MFTLPHHSWRLVSEQLQRMVAARYDAGEATVSIGSPTRPGSPLVTHNPETGRLAISPRVVNNIGGSAPLGQVTDITFQLQQPSMFGGIIAALGHLRHSPWRRDLEPQSVNDKTLATALRLDQIRVESRESRRRPANRLLVQHYAAHHCIDGVSARENLSTLVTTLMIDLYGRVMAGVFSDGSNFEVSSIVPTAVAEAVGQEKMHLLRDIISATLRLDGDDRASMLQLAESWNDLTIDMAQQLATTGRLPLLFGRALDAVEDVASKEIRLYQLKYPPVASLGQRTQPPGTLQEWVNQFTDEQDIDTEPEQDEEESEADWAGGVGLPSNRWVEYRAPTQEEKSQAAAVSQRLKELRYRQPTRVSTPTQVPTGRLNTRELIQFQAQVKKQTTITATPWTRKDARNVEQPGLTCALVLDTSVSMGLFRNSLMSLNWALAHGATAVGGTVSAWGFGGDAFEILRPGTTPRQVPIARDTGAGSSGSAEALANAALDANLIGASGSRVAIVVTDAALDEGAGGGEEAQRLSTIFETLRDQGVHTLLLQVGNTRMNSNITGAQIVQCPWSADLADTLTNEIISAYVST